MRRSTTPVSTSSSRAKTTRLTRAELVRRRLAAHAFGGVARAVDVVRAYGAMQAQDYLAALWAVGLRGGGGVAEVEAALAAGDVVRTHPLRNTIHLVAREDVRWMLALTATRMWERAQPRYRELGLDAAVLAKAERVLGKLFAGGGVCVTRAELAAQLARGGVEVGGQRFVHLVHHAELRGLVCSTARGFAWLDDVVAPAPEVGREEAAARLARRYFARRGPATVDDFTWWSGLAAGEARAACAAVAGELVAEVMDGATYYSVPAVGDSARAHLLPAFDEYTVAYRDRAAIAPAGLTGFQLLSPVVVVDGRVVGTWKRARGKGAVAIAVTPVVRAPRAAIEEAAARYAAFLGLSPRVTVAALR